MIYDARGRAENRLVGGGRDSFLCADGRSCDQPVVVLCASVFYAGEVACAHAEAGRKKSVHTSVRTIVQSRPYLDAFCEDHAARC